MSTRGIDTKLVHAGEPRPRILGAVVMPIFQTAMHEYAGEAEYDDLKYIRLNNTPNHRVLHAKLAALENAEMALVTASGMAAITTTLISLMKQGDHMLFQDNLYGGTHDFVVKDFARFGYEYDLIDGRRPETWKDKLRPNTRGIYVEGITNPLIQVADLPAVTAFAREHGIVSLIDNTFASPVNFRPLDIGFDLVLHSATKYLNGHSDIIAGVVAGSDERVHEVRRKLNHTGGSLDPHACFLLHRGLKTLGLRVRQQGKSALALAQMLAGHPKVKQVNYPGLETHPDHARARELFSGFGGMLSMELEGGEAAATTFMEKAEIPVLAPSLGGPETLLTLPARTSHLGLSRAAREQMGVTDGLIRVSVGLEDTDDLLADFKQAL